MSWRENSGITPSKSSTEVGGLRPKMPQNDAGFMMEASVSLPRLIGASPALTPAAEPELEAPHECEKEYGLWQAPPVSLA